MSCQARQVNDQMHCHACGLQWDVNDPEPPECQRGKLRVDQIADTPKQLELGAVEPAPEIVSALYFPRSTNWLPADLTDDLAFEMARTYHANLTEGYTGRLRAMRAAYRLLLDRVAP